MELYTSKDVKKTRKEHRCHLCGLKIPVGLACLYEAGKHDGDFFSRYSHNECAEKWVDMNSDSIQDDDWLGLDCMSEVYPHDSFHTWKALIIKKVH